MFRGQCINNNEEVRGWLVKHGFRNQYRIVPLKDAIFANYENRLQVKSYRVRPSSIGMQTGVKDKNDKEIYGSIKIDGEMSRGGHNVKYKSTEQCGGFVEINQEPVRFVNGKFVPMAWHRELDDCWYDYIISDLEIIGNQWDEQSRE